jgi:hypothetical protein
MTKPGMLSFFSRNRAAHLFLGALLIWSLLPLEASSGSTGLNRVEPRENFVQGQACSLPIIADHRGKHLPDQQLSACARTPLEVLEAFERTLTEERATVIRTFLPPPARVVRAQHMSSDL